MIARDDRLRRGWEVERTRTGGTSVANRRMVLFSRPNELGRTRFGVAAGKRLGNAVRRNRAKRLMREALRLSAPGVAPGHDILLIARNGLRADDALDDVLKDVRYLLRKAGLQLPPSEPSTTGPTNGTAASVSATPATRQPTSADATAPSAAPVPASTSSTSPPTETGAH